MYTRPRLTSRAVEVEGAFKVTRPEMPGYEAFTYTSANGSPCAYAYRGRRLRPDWHKMFRDEQQRAETIDGWFRLYEGRAAAETRRKQLQTQPNPCTVGQVFVSSWGYEQTNVDFLEVVEVKGKSVVVRKIAAEVVDDNAQGLPDPAQSMADKVVARRGRFIGEPQLKRVRYNSDGTPYLSMASYADAYPWDGGAKNRSSYG